MKQFEIKILNRKLLITIALPIAIVYIIFALLYIIDKTESSNSIVPMFLVAMIPLGIFIAILNKVCRKSYMVELDDSKIRLKRNGLIEKSVNFSDIMLIRKSAQNQVTSLFIFTEGHQKPDIELLQVANAFAMQEIQDILLASNTYIATQRASKNQIFQEYINQSMINSQAAAIASLKSDKMPGKTKLIIISTLVFFILVPILAIIVANGTNNNDSYMFERDGIYFKDKKLDINPDEVARLNHNLIKDSSHVYYKGEILEWADRATFKSLQTPFYSDKNGVYYETNKMFTDNQILPLPGDYDHASFKAVGVSYYKDKNNLYKFNFSLTKSSENPLDKVDLEGIDLTTFEGVGDYNAYYWFKDKNRVYFASEKKLKVADGIDSESFECLTWEVAKDKNHVYYITKDLKSDEHSATDYANYAILEGADAPTFEKVGYNEFKDKNTEWTIDR